MACRDAARPLRRPEEREEHRRFLHKSSSPNWKDAYRQRCRDRLQASRYKFLSGLRKIAAENQEESDTVFNSSSTSVPTASVAPSSAAMMSSVQTVVMEEWEHVREQYGNLPQIPQSKQPQVFNSCTPPCVASSNSQRDDAFPSPELEEDIEVVLCIMEELTQELIREEQALLMEYKECLQLEEDALCAAVQSLSTDDVMCPICQKDFLHQNKHIIFCSCGVRLDTAHDGIRLDYMRQQLDHYTQEHSSWCTGSPEFSIESVIDTQTIIMNCNVCGFMEVIV